MDWALVWEDPHKSRSVQGTQGEGHLGLRADLKQYIYTHMWVCMCLCRTCVIIRELRATDPKQRTCASSRDPFGKLSELRGGTL